VTVAAFSAGYLPSKAKADAAAAAGAIADEAAAVAAAPSSSVPKPTIALMKKRALESLYMKTEGVKLTGSVANKGHYYACADPTCSKHGEPFFIGVKHGTNKNLWAHANEKHPLELIRLGLVPANQRKYTAPDGTEVAQLAFDDELNFSVNVAL
jgi:hypothetical protein